MQNTFSLYLYRSFAILTCNQILCCADFRAQRQLVKNPPDLCYNLWKATAERAKYLQTVKGFRCENPINPIKIDQLRYAGVLHGQRVRNGWGIREGKGRVRAAGTSDVNLMKFQLKVIPGSTCQRVLKGWPICRELLLVDYRRRSLDFSC